MKKLITIVLFILIPALKPSLFAETPPAIITLNSLNCEVKSNHECIYQIEREVLVNNKKGQEYSIHPIYFANRNELRKISITLYDKNKQLIRKIDPDAMLRHSVFSYSLFEDNSVAEINVGNDTYPYYLSIKYEIKLKEYLTFPEWEPQPFEKIATIYSAYTLTLPADFHFNYRFYNCQPKEEIIPLKDKIVYKWVLGEIMPINLEDCARPFKIKIPYGLFIPQTFMYADKDGISDSWGLFGKWVSDIEDGLDLLPDEEINKIRDLTKEKKTEVEKISVLYKYMQRNIRYVSVQIGSGGYKTYSAAYVCKNKYGDCKAMSNYMHAMLRVAGIPSSLVLVRAGENEPEIDTSFVYPGDFNHCILCIPLKNDTVWLECTSSNNPPNYLGTFTAGKQVLIINGNKSTLKSTPKYGKDRNFIHVKSEVEIKKDQTWSITVSKQYNGYETDEIRNRVRTLPDEKLKKWFINSQPYQEIALKSIQYTCNDSFPLVTGNISFTCRRKAGPTPVHATMTKLSDYCPISKQNRTEDIFIPNSYEYTDTTIFTFPLEYKLLALPSSREISARFGSYSKKVIQEKNSVMIVRTLSKNSGTYSKEHIPEFNEFSTGINKLENEEVVYSANE